MGLLVLVENIRCILYISIRFPGVLTGQVTFPFDKEFNGIGFAATTVSSMVKDGFNFKFTGLWSHRNGRRVVRSVGLVWLGFVIWF